MAEHSRYGGAAQAVDWERIAQTEFLFEEQCWKQCGGYCCSSGCAEFQFQLIPTHGATVLYLAQEHAHLAARGQTPEHVPGTHAVAQPLALDFGGPEPLVLMQLFCNLLGQCHGRFPRPLHCRLYPFLPVFDAEERLTDLLPFSVFDATTHARGQTVACPLWSKRDEYLRRWREAPELLAPLRHPVFLLYFHAARHFHDLYVGRLMEQHDLLQLEGAAFWKAWELAYLSGRLLDGERLRERVRNSYNTLVERHGPFSYSAQAGKETETTE